MADTSPNPDIDPSEAHGLIAQVLGGGTSMTDLELSFEIPGVEIHHRIGRGGMGEVYFATLVESGEEVAVKILNPASDGDPLSAERFIREGETLDRLNHPNLLKICGRGELPDGRPFFITDYAEGGTLDDVLRSGVRLEEEVIHQYARELCAGLAEVHAVGLVHRDIKPSNLLIDGEGRLIVADFGLAKTLHVEATELTLSGTSLGTANYMAPEQSLPGAKIDARADVFAVGVVLYKMLTGELPKGQFKPPSRFQRSRDWDRIIASCLATSPMDRVGDAVVLEKRIQKLTFDSQSRRKWLATGAGAAALFGVGYIANEIRISAIDSGWIDLLPTFDLGPPWSFGAEGSLLCNEPVESGMAFAEFDPGDSYELRLTWRRTEGTASLCVFLPTLGGICQFEMGAWRREWVGIQSIDGSSLLEPGNDSVRMTFVNGEDYDIFLQVTPETIRFSINDDSPVEVDIAGKRLSLVELWRTDVTDRIGFGAWLCRAEFSRLDYRALA